MRFLFLLIILFYSLPLFAFDHSYAKYGEFLDLVVEYKDEGKRSLVRYKTASRNRQNLEDFLKSTEEVTQREFDAWSKDQQLSFLINTYNGRVVQLVAKNQRGLKSIKDIAGWFSSVFNKDFFNLFGAVRNLNYIEHDLIRKNYNEPRIHFAINCAAKSCPALQKRPYLPETLIDQLEASTKNFLQSKFNKFSFDNNFIQVSRIFEWFASDFIKKYGSVQAFVVPYMTPHQDERDILLGENVHVVYSDYNWDLNRYFE